MMCDELKVVCLNITEDFYDYKGTFELCAGDIGMNLDIADLDEEKLKEVKSFFGLSESLEDIRSSIMSKVLEASNIESRNIQ